MGRSNKEEYERRLADCESTMIRLRSSYRVEEHLAKKYSVHQRNVRKWIRAVRDKWKSEAKEVDKEAHRNDLVATLNEVIFMAMNRSTIVKNDDGTVVLDTNQNSPTFGKPVVKQNPDLQRVLHAVIQLRAIHGADEPTRSKVTITPDLQDMPKVGDLPPVAEDALRAFLKTVAPDGDITKLAGDFFHEDT